MRPNGGIFDILKFVIQMYTKKFHKSVEKLNWRCQIVKHNNNIECANKRIVYLLTIKNIWLAFRIIYFICLNNYLWAHFSYYHIQGSRGDISFTSRCHVESNPPWPRRCVITFCRREFEANRLFVDGKHLPTNIFQVIFLFKILLQLINVISLQKAFKRSNYQSIF